MPVVAPPNPASVAHGSVDPLRGSFAEFARPTGPDLLARTAPIVPWIMARREAHVWPYARAVTSAPGTTTHAEAETQSAIRYGLNFATQDYLSLASHPSVQEAAMEALRRYGVHSGGSAALQGRSDISRALETEIGETLNTEHVVLFSSGWGAAFGAVTALVRPDDHIVLDRLAHNSLQTGANAATRNITHIEHINVDALRRALAGIRAGDASNGILVVTEGLFSMDSDSPDLRAMQAVCHEYQATLLVDVAHDFGSLGPGGTGHIGREGMLGEIDLVMGAFSKTFASNGGFVATRHPGVRAYLEAYGGPHTFSNSMSPIQIATVREALRIVRSEEGDARRASLMSVVHTLRGALAEQGLTCLGDPSAVVPVLIGQTSLARVASAGVLERGLFANLVEFPAVGVRAARFRMQAMSDHTPQQAREAAALLADAVREARERLAPPGTAARQVAA
ncbi:aminotransferase class I and II [Gemmatirosa kalamazoonensis]|uniref:Aminotransferase class I and II n=2 Tax=Gemmatirosa kalamazoonensis TaxID=861299 RepID=W0RFH2_9BACT|nr:aminotransferase class I and II [Gemmatirosa kalamazoonensis]